MDASGESARQETKDPVVICSLRPGCQHSSGVRMMFRTTWSYKGACHECQRKKDVCTDLRVGANMLNENPNEGLTESCEPQSLE